MRTNQLDVKALMVVEQSLEQWRPVLKLDFPLPSQTKLTEEIFPLLGVSAPVLSRESYSAEQFLDEVARPHADVRLAQVFKQLLSFHGWCVPRRNQRSADQRRGYSVRSC